MDVVQLVSDVHCEFFDYRKPHSLPRIEPHPNAVFLVLAGDIGYPFQPSYETFLRQCSRDFPVVLVIAGNHDLWHRHRGTPYYAKAHRRGAVYTVGRIRRQIQSVCSKLPNVHFLEQTALYFAYDTATKRTRLVSASDVVSVGECEVRMCVCAPTSLTVSTLCPQSHCVHTVSTVSLCPQSVELSDGWPVVRFLGATMWTDVSAEQERAVVMTMQDYRYITTTECDEAVHTRRIAEQVSPAEQFAEIDDVEWDAFDYTEHQPFGVTVRLQVRLWRCTSLTLLCRSSSTLIGRSSRSRLCAAHRRRRALQRQWHRMTVDWLRWQLGKDAETPTVVVTHHAPSMVMDTRAAGSLVSTAFSTELDAASLFRRPVVAWISGHTHDCVDVLVNDVRLVSNCMGYRDETRSPNYRTTKTISLPVVTA
jgi:hypothetical protein